MAQLFCGPDSPDWVLFECGIERAGIIALLLIDVDESPTRPNLESASFVQARIAASPQNYVLIQPTRGDYAGGTATEEDGFGRALTQTTGADHVVNLEMEGIIDNRDSIESYNRKKWKIAFFTNGGLLYYVTVPVTFYATPSNPRGIKNGSFWKATCKWSDLSNPIICNAPDILANIG